MLGPAHGHPLRLQISSRPRNARRCTREKSPCTKDLPASAPSALPFPLISRHNPYLLFQSILVYVSTMYSYERYALSTSIGHPSPHSTKCAFLSPYATTLTHSSNHLHVSSRIIKSVYIYPPPPLISISSLYMNKNMPMSQRLGAVRFVVNSGSRWLDSCCEVATRPPRLV